MSELSECILAIDRPRAGVCQKCGRYRILQSHHFKGYGEGHKDEVLLYCHSCDLKAHAKARRDGQCTLNHDEVNIKSKNSYRRRAERRIEFNETVGTNVLLYETIIFNQLNGNVYVVSRFQGNHDFKLPVVEVS